MIKGMALVAGVFVLTVFAVSGYAMMGCSSGQSNGSAHAEEGRDAEKADAIVNKACPITGEAIDKNITYEYKGKVYGFCCQMCIEEFKKDPEKYIAKIGGQSKSASAEDMHEGHPH